MSDLKNSSNMSTPNKLGEFDLIEHFFKEGAAQQGLDESVSLGIGDDCALLNLRENNHLAISTDMLVEGRHFLAGSDPHWLGRKCLAVNLSDLAAMGAKPIAFTLAIAMPSVKHEWLSGFSEGLFEIAQEFNCRLIGGDTTAGPLTISITIFGEVPQSKALQRQNAQVGDDVWVSHQVGDARLALGALRHEWSLTEAEMKTVSQRMHNPMPRVELGQALLGVAHSAIDISDGLLGDLSHILRKSNVSADIEIDQVPASEILKSKSIELRRLCSLMGGDDYELCFTAPSESAQQIEKISVQLGIRLTRIGRITSGLKSNTSSGSSTQLIRLIDSDGQELPAELSTRYLKSFDHFK